MAQHIVITASGTGVGMWDTTPPQPAAVATALDQTLCYWQPLGNYPASVTNPQMGQSVQDGVNEIVRLLNEVYPPGNSRGTSFMLFRYSQCGGPLTGPDPCAPQLDRCVMEPHVRDGCHRFRM